VLFVPEQIKNRFDKDAFRRGGRNASAASRRFYFRALIFEYVCKKEQKYPCKKQSAEYIIELQFSGQGEAHAES